jgi:hypothetical protein
MKVGDLVMLKRLDSLIYGLNEVSRGHDSIMGIVTEVPSDGAAWVMFGMIHKFVSSMHLEVINES